jgi:hypothetical protein
MDTQMMDYIHRDMGAVTYVINSYTLPILDVSAVVWCSDGTLGWVDIGRGCTILLGIDV